MKAFACALSVLIILSLAVTANAIYVQKQTIALTDEIEKLPAEIENANLTDIRKKWDKIEPIISYSVSHKELDQIADALSPQHRRDKRISRRPEEIAGFGTQTFRIRRFFPEKHFLINGMHCRLQKAIHVGVWYSTHSH